MELTLKTDKKFLMNLILSFIAINFIIYPKLVFVQIFASFYIVLIYKKFAKDFMDMLYYSIILFSIIGFYMKFNVIYSIYYYYVLILLYMSIITIKSLKNKSYKLCKKKHNKYFVFICIFFIYMVLSVFIVSSKSEAIKYIIMITMMIALAVIMFIQIKNIKQLENTFEFLFLLFVGIILLGILQIFGLYYGIENAYNRGGIHSEIMNFTKHIPTTFFYNPNNYAVFLVMGMICLIIYYQYSKQRKDKLIIITAYIIAQVNLIFSRSRTGWISIVLAIFLLILFYMIKKLKVNQIKYKQKIIEIGLFLVITACVFTMFSFIPKMQPFYSKFSMAKYITYFKEEPDVKLVENINDDSNKSKNKNESPITIGGSGSNNERITLIYDVIKGVFKEKHFMGFGAGNIEIYIKSLNNTNGKYNIHSFWFEILGNFGVVIFLYMVYVYLSLILDNIKNHNKCDYKGIHLMCAAVMIIFILLAFAPSSIRDFAPFWMLLGIATKNVFLQNTTNMKYFTKEKIKSHR